MTSKDAATVVDWQVDHEQAIKAVSWVIGLVAPAMENGRRRRRRRNRDNRR
jgi:hypothetical protein